MALNRLNPLALSSQGLDPSDLLSRPLCKPNGIPLVAWTVQTRRHNAHLTGGALKLAENRVIADLLLQGLVAPKMKQEILAENVLQARRSTKSTSKPARVCEAAIARPVDQAFEARIEPLLRPGMARQP